MDDKKILNCPYIDESKTKTCKCSCGKGEVITVYIVTESKTMQGYESMYTTCPDNCEDLSTKNPISCCSKQGLNSSSNPCTNSMYVILVI